MSIHRLTLSTSRLLHSTQILPSFEAAVLAVAQNSVQQGARTIHITIVPPALRFTVEDDGPGFSPSDWQLALQPGCTSLPGGRGQSLAALSALAAVELHTRRGRFHARKLVRGGVLLDASSREPHAALCDRDGVVVDVWELFHGIPVRRRAETARDLAIVVDATRDAIVALSLANPHVAVTLQGSNAIPFYTSPIRAALSIDMIQTAFGNAYGLDWRRVRGSGGTALRLDGFVARRGGSTSAICLVSLDGLPVLGKGWIHKAVRRAWKAYVARCGAGDPSLNKFPAYVLNCEDTAARGPENALMRETCTRRAPPSDRVEQAVFSAVHAALVGETVPQQTGKATTVSELQLLSFASARKRKASAMQERFSDALISKRVRKPDSSLWASRGARRELIRPLSEGSVLAGRRYGQERLPAWRVCIGRPSTVEGVESAYSKCAAGWSNPCFRGKARVSRKAGASWEDGEHRVHSLFEKRGVNISRDKISKLRIVGQVDRKFIVVVDDDSVMYAVDQHAASERYMYETLLEQTTANKIDSASVTPPQGVELSYKQRVTAEHYGATLSQWGWKLRLSEGPHVQLVGAPELRRLGVVLDSGMQLRTYLNSLDSGAARHATPRPVLDAIASAACHAAVRFGDELSGAQCRSLVDSLAECDSPFVCAHGRPSIVPLAVFDDR